MRVLVACEFSAVVRDAFLSLGHDAWSCDIESTEGNPERHIEADALDVARNNHWDLMIAFPPCTHLAVSGAWCWERKRASGAQQAAVRFVTDLYDLPIERVAIENPVGYLSSAWRKPDQIIQPWQHGHGETKATCLWLKGLPKLTPTNVVGGREARILGMGESKARQRNRSRTYAGFAAAMATQWGLGTS